MKRSKQDKNKKIEHELKIIKNEKNQTDPQDLLKKCKTKNKKQENSVKVRNFKSQTEKMILNKGSQTEVKLQETEKKSESMIADKKTVAINNKMKRRTFFLLLTWKRLCFCVFYVLF